MPHRAGAERWTGLPCPTGGGGKRCASALRPYVRRGTVSEQLVNERSRACLLAERLRRCAYARKQEKDRCDWKECQFHENVSGELLTTSLDEFVSPFSTKCKRGAGRVPERAAGLRSGTAATCCSFSGRARRSGGESLAPRCRGRRRSPSGPLGRPSNRRLCWRSLHRGKKSRCFRRCAREFADLPADLCSPKASGPVANVAFTFSQAPDFALGGGRRSRPLAVSDPG